MTRWSELSDEALAGLARRAKHELPDVPLWLTESVVVMWRSPPAAAATGLSFLDSVRRQLVAALRFDSWAAQPTLALRSALAQSRQLLFTAEGRDIDLRVSHADPGAQAGAQWTVAGQVLGPGDNGVISMHCTGQAPESAALDEFGEFRFAGLAPGPCVVTLRFGDVEIVLPEIDLGAEPQG